MKKIALIFIGIGLLTAGCNTTQKKEFLGSAVIEVKTYQVGSTMQGQVVAVFKDEGSPVTKGDVCAIIDTVPLILNLKELAASFQELERQIGSKQDEIGAVKSDIAGVKRERDRVAGLVGKGSLPQQQLDNLETQYSSAQLKVKSASAMAASLNSKLEGLRAREATLRDNLARCYVKAPCSGTVITVFKNTGEVAGPAAPLLEIGAYDTVEADFFVSQPVISGLKTGQEVRIRVDRAPNTGDKRTEMFVPAKISWISEDAEFSPKNIQTRETRNELVFKVRVRAANSQGLLKRGLPVEIWQ